MNSNKSSLKQLPTTHKATPKFITCMLHHLMLPGWKECRFEDGAWGLSVVVLESGIDDIYNKLQDFEVEMAI